MSKVTGILEKAYQGKGGYWSINVNDTWYGTYEHDYTALEGQEVEFEASKRGKYWNAKDVKSTGNSAAKPKSTGGNAGYNAEERQNSIVLQSSYKTAAEFLGSLITAGHINLGAKKAGQYDTAMGLLDETARRIFDNCSDPASFLSDEDAPGPGDDDDEWSHD